MKKIKNKQINIKEVRNELLNIAINKEVAEQLTGAEQRMLYNAVYSLNKALIGLNKETK